MTIKTSTRFTAHVVLPIAVGAAIYIGWRSKNLLVFDWIDATGLNFLVYRPNFALPGWAAYSLPDGCWVYAYTSWMLIIWGRLVPWVFTGVVLAVVAEFGQLFGIVQGTFDIVDLLFYVCAFLLARFLNEKAHLVNGCNGDDGYFRSRQRDP